MDHFKLNDILIKNISSKTNVLVIDQFKIKIVKFWSLQIIIRVIFIFVFWLTNIWMTNINCN